MLRAWLSSSAIACSAALMMFDCGAFTTMTPRRVAASTSTLSRPIAGARDHFRSRRRQDRLGHLRGAADDQRVVRRDLRREVAFR